MTERTALEIADEIDGGLRCTPLTDVAKLIRQQHPEIEMLRAYVGKNTLMSDFRNADEMRAALDRLKRERHHIYDLLARIHRDGGQYTAEHGIEKSCDDAEAQVVTWLDTLSSVDALIEQARIAEREACAEACDELEAMLPGTKTGNTLQWASEKIRARGKS